MLLTLGVISIVLTIWIAKRMRILDSETAPYSTVFQGLIYFVWLFAEIVKANIAVVRAVLSPDMTVSPTLTRIPTPQKTDIGRVMFANSITLTPGTVSVDVQDDHILVHALLSEMSDPDDFAEMSNRSAWAIGEDVDAPNSRQQNLKASEPVTEPAEVDQNSGEIS